MLATWVSVALLLPGVAVAQATDEVGHRHMPVERIPSPPGVRAVWLPPADMLYNNGAVADGTEASCSGDDGNASILQTALGGASLGFNAGSSASLDFRLADDFVIPAGPSWAVSSAYLFAYQTGSGNTSTITGVNVRIWNGPPSNAASTVVCGDTSSSAMTATAFSGIFRMADSALDCSRPIMVETVDLSGCPALASGTYWIDWQMTGTVNSGPFTPPIVIDGQAATGNALQADDGVWSPVADLGNFTGQGMPFVIAGASAGDAIFNDGFDGTTP